MDQVEKVHKRTHLSLEVSSIHTTPIRRQHQTCSTKPAPAETAPAVQRNDAPDPWVGSGFSLLLKKWKKIDL